MSNVTSTPNIAIPALDLKIGETTFSTCVESHALHNGLVRAMGFSQWPVMKLTYRSDRGDTMIVYIRIAGWEYANEGRGGIGVHPYRFVKEMSSYFLAIAAVLTENDPEHRQWTLNTRKDISPSLEKTANFFGAPWASKHMFLGSARSRLMLRMRLHNLVYSVQAVPSAFADAEFDDFDDTVLYYPGRRIGSLPDGQLVQFQIESPIQGFSLYSHCEGAPLALDHDSPNEVWQFVMQLMKSAWPQFENIAELFMPLSVDKPWASNQ